MLSGFLAALRRLWGLLTGTPWPGGVEVAPSQVPTDPPPRRTRQTGVLRAVLRLLAEGPYSSNGVVFHNPLFTRAQIQAALAYAARCGYVELGPACGEWKVARWSITEAGLARLKVKAEAPPQAQALAGDSSRPGAWFPAKFGVPRGVPLAGQPIRPDPPPEGTKAVWADPDPPKDYTYIPWPLPGPPLAGQPIDRPETGYTSPEIGHTSEPTT